MFNLEKRFQIILISFLTLILVGGGIYYKYYLLKFKQDNPDNPEIIQRENEKEDRILVYICGGIKKSGIYKLNLGARIIELINLAGGTLKEADLEKVNLVKKLKDGEKVYIPLKNKKYNKNKRKRITRSLVYKDKINLKKNNKKEKEPDANQKEQIQLKENNDLEFLDDVVEYSGRNKPKLEGKISLNLAGLEELTQIPGIGEILAKRILKYREIHGNFLNLEKLKKIPGLGENNFLKLKTYLKI
ncbi:MAG: helix-hairpin-helix domain-containing protein [Armatimonadetes bacterium]|nr:helix-hairpin-helix domain-containing protein [Armatimonadota bacterium]